MKRRLFPILCGLSLLLFVAVIVLWVRSYRISEGVWFAPSTARAFVQSTNGEVSIGWLKDPIQLNLLHYFAHRPDHPMTPPFSRQRWLGFLVEWNSIPAMTLAGVQLGPMTYAVVVVPYWAVVLTVTLGGVVLCTRMRVREAIVGVCSACGYDLRATPDRCPECGYVPTSSPSPSESG